MNLDVRRSARNLAAGILRNVHFPGRFRVYQMLKSVLGENTGRFVVSLDGGGKLLVDGIVDSQFFFLGDLDWNVDHFLLRSVSPGSIVFDIGANIGAYTIPMALRVGDLGHVYAFEAFRPNYEMLLESIAINKLTNVTAVFGAVTDSSGVLEVPNPARNESKNIGNYSLATRSTNRTTIPSLSLDDFVVKHGIDRVDLMKMDIEGSETIALKGARSLFATRKVGTVVLEINPHWLARMGSSVEELWGIVESLGGTLFLVTRFSRTKQIDKNYVFDWLLRTGGSGKLDVALKYSPERRGSLAVNRATKQNEGLQG
jgi:FkbM family methyltransferase